MGQPRSDGVKFKMARVVGAFRALDLDWHIYRPNWHPSGWLLLITLKRIADARRRLDELEAHILRLKPASDVRRRWNDEKTDS